MPRGVLTIGGNAGNAGHKEILCAPVTPALALAGNGKLAGALAGRMPGLWLGLTLALEIERHCGAYEILQGRLIDLIVFVDVDGASDISFETGVEET